MQVFINNNARFRCQSKEKILSTNLLQECKYEPRKIKMENLIDDDLEKSSPDDSDNDSNDETESDDKKDNDEFDE